MEEESPGEAPFKGKAGFPPLTQAQIEKARLKKNEGFFDPTMLKTSKFSTLSGQKTGEKFSFSKANRFPSASKDFSEALRRSKSSPAWSGQTSTAASDGGGEASIEFTSAEPSRVLSGHGASIQEPAGPSSGFADNSDDELNEGSISYRHPRPPATDHLSAPRLDGSCDRLGEIRAIRIATGAQLRPCADSGPRHLRRSCMAPATMVFWRWTFAL